MKTITQPAEMLCPQCYRPSDQAQGIECSMCMDARCRQCCEFLPDGDDGLCPQCGAESQESLVLA